MKGQLNLYIKTLSFHIMLTSQKHNPKGWEY
jgi:hypothetical protein